MKWRPVGIRRPQCAAYADAAFESLETLVGSLGLRLTGTRACDFGAGTGLLTAKLAEICGHVDAIDKSDGMLKALRSKSERLGWRNVRALAALPSGTKHYDLVVCSSVLGFVDDYPATVEQLVSRMNCGGLLVQWDWVQDPDTDEPHGFTSEQVRRTLEGSGLVDVGVRRAFSVDVDGAAMTPLLGFGRRPG